jgi:hypothetical protein
VPVDINNGSAVSRKKGLEEVKREVPDSLRFRTGLEAVNHRLDFAGITHGAV